MTSNTIIIRRIALALGCVLVSATGASGGDWVEMGPAPIITGPWTGRCSCIIASPTDMNKWFVGGASGGVWRTLDGGSTWEPLTDQLPILSIGALAMDPANEDVVYAGSGEANFANHCYYGLGLYKTTDGGDTWAVLAADTFSGRTFSRIVVSHGDSNTLYASIMHAGGFMPTRNAAKGHPRADDPVGVYRSLDGGVTWSQLTNGLPAVGASDIWMDPSDPSTLYAAIGDIFGHADNGVYKSTDGGDSWFELGGGLPTTSVGRISLAIAPTMPQRVLAVITNPSDQFGGGATLRNVYLSDDGGSTWSAKNPGNFQATYGWYLSTAIFNPIDENIMFVGGLELLRSTNGGDTWSTVTPPHVDMHGLAYEQHLGLLCANDGGVHRSSNHGSSWAHKNTSLGTAQLYPGISTHPTNEVFVLAGLQDNGTNRREVDGVIWSHRIGGDGGFTALHPDNPDTMFGELQGTGWLYRSTNGGDTFQLSNGGINTNDRNCFLPPIQYFPTNSNSLYYATHRIYRSVNNGGLWSALSGDLTTGAPYAVRAIAVAPTNTSTIYAATNDGRVLVSTNGGFGWSIKLEDMPGWPRCTRELAVDPTDDATVYLAVNQFDTDQVRKSADYGDTWEVIDGDLPNVPVNCVAVQHTETDHAVFVGTDAGVYATFNDGANWSEVGALPHTPVMDLVIDTAHNRLVVGTMGRGAWWVELPVAADADDDGDVDLLDGARFLTCFSGSIDQPGYDPPTQECLAVFDRDGDLDVDLVDFADFVPRLLGPS